MSEEDLPPPLKRFAAALTRIAAPTPGRDSERGAFSEVRLCIDLNCRNLDPATRAILVERLGRLADADQIVVLVASTERSQHKNNIAVLEKLQRALEND